ncbi:permease prefix domain 1-containing protein [Pseudonocardia cypriaca]|uniref:permease prefix domain 1-containing protein n=1 Tax=Pseudonocardia cypriaca TaxID=882449 RepID=UPI001151E6C5|nr:permease prefix domain 1-containing protein [Pseudonocardia cypriaca]
MTDPVGAHVAELDRALHGPAALKRSMIAEVRHGLADAVACHQDRGLEPQRAAAEAVREFGSVHEVAPLLQEELTARQGRRTAQLVVVAFPALLLAWDALWMTGQAWQSPPSPMVGSLARAVDVLTVLITVAALVLLLATFRDGPLPRWVTTLSGLVAALGVAGCGGMSLVMNLLKPHAAGELFAANPATAVVLTATALIAALVTRSAVRSLRFAHTRRAARVGPSQT